MRPNFERMSFADAYYLANNVRQAIVEWPDDAEIDDLLDFTDQEVLERLAKPHRWSLLHLFIGTYFDRGNDEFELHRNDMLDIVVAEYRTILELHSIPIPLVDIPKDDADDYETQMQQAIETLRSELPLVTIVNSAFQLLYGDRPFLHRFNEFVAKHVSEMTVEAHPDVLDRDGILTRARQLPAWLKNGVFHRDRGRCALCHKDMTGIIATSEERHYDHIIPRALGGCNDPTNFQLLCRDCNLSKGAAQCDVSRLVPVYWALD